MSRNSIDDAEQRFFSVTCRVLCGSEGKSTE